MSVRIGHGFDIHRLKRGRALMLGGVRVPHTHGGDGHSDADVLLHALTDALLGACGAGDIGSHFPPSDKRWKNAPSTLFVKHALALAAKRGFAVVNADATIYAEAPKLAPRRADICRNLARILGVGAAAVNVKFKTMERLDAVGRGEAVAAETVVLVKRRAKRQNRRVIGGRRSGAG